MDGLTVDRFPVSGALIVGEGVKERFSKSSVRVWLMIEIWG